MCQHQEEAGKKKDAAVPISPWSKLLKQVSKSKLKQTSKLNLNKYWCKFGELMMSPSKAKVVQKTPPTRSKKQLFADAEPQIPAKTEDVNLIKGRYELFDLEVNENLANEIKEIWSFRSVKCHVCTAG